YGCDSVIATHLMVEEIVHFTRDVEVCEGGSVIAGGALQTTTGTYYDTLVTAFGCDSVVITNFTVHSESTITVTPAICQGESYFAGGDSRTTAGTYRDTFFTTHGCDSIVITILTVNPVYNISRSVSICQGESF